MVTGEQISSLAIGIESFLEITVGLVSYQNIYRREQIVLKD